MFAPVRSTYVSFEMASRKCVIMISILVGYLLLFLDIGLFLEGRWELYQAPGLPRASARFFTGQRADGGRSSSNPGFILTRGPDSIELEWQEPDPTSSGS